MRIAYLILAHTNAGQLKRLVKKLHSANTWIFLHLDIKTPMAAEFLDIPKEAPNASFIRGRVDVRWGGFSIIQAVLNSLGEIAVSGVEFDYIHLMSGSDYPVKANSYIFDYLGRNPGHEFIHYSRLPVDEFSEDRMDRVWYYYDYDNIHSRFGSPGSSFYEEEMKRRGVKRSFLPGMRPYHGSTWWCLTGNCVRYLLDLISREREILNFFRYAKIPDEQFFQTLVMNSPFAAKAFNENLWYLDWRAPGALHPKTLDMGDFCELQRTPALYARKFDPHIDPVLLDRIDAMTSLS